MGYTPSLFWECSLLEIYDLIDSYNRRKKNEMKEFEEKIKIQISLNSVLARQIAENIGSILDENIKITPLNKLFPTLFEADNDEVNNDMALYKAKMEEFAFRHNQRLKRKEE